MENPDLTTELVRNLPAIIMAIGSAITAIGVILIGYWTYLGNKKRDANAAELAAQTAMLKGVEVKVDGMTSELVAATSAQKMAEGQLAERDAERAYQDTTTTDEPQKVKIVKPDLQS